MNVKAFFASSPAARQNEKSPEVVLAEPDFERRRAKPDFMRGALT
jgi:hypothetical protein